MSDDLNSLESSLEPRSLLIDLQRPTKDNRHAIPGSWAVCHTRDYGTGRSYRPVPNKNSLAVDMRDARLPLDIFLASGRATHVSLLEKERPLGMTVLALKRIASIIAATTRSICHCTAAVSWSTRNPLRVTARKL